MNQDLALPADIHEITAGRDKAIELWLGTYDSFHASTKAAALASVGGYIALPRGRGSNYEDTELTDAFMQEGERDFRDPVHGRYVKRPARDRFLELITAEVDRRCWQGLLNQLGFDQLLDRQAREDFHKSLEGVPPAFTPDNCAATFGHLWINRREIYLRGIANVFMALDRRFRSHDGFKIGGRLIINSAVNSSGWWSDYNRRDTLHDVERIFRELEGLPTFDNSSAGDPDRYRYGPPDMRNWGIVRRISNMLQANEPTPFVIHADYFRVRVFGNGNLHLWFERKDLLESVNKLLAEYYGEVIGDGYNETQAEETPGYHVTPAKEFGAFMSSTAVADRVMGIASIHPGDRVLEPSAGTGVLAKAARENGGEVDCVEIQPGMAHELGLAGFRTICEDFLKVRPTPLYDVIVMNPPFDRGRDCDHVRHATGFLKPGGQLVAIMSARAEYGSDKRHDAFRKSIEGWRPTGGREPWIDLPAGSFAHAGTNVNTVILSVRKPK